MSQATRNKNQEPLLTPAVWRLLREAGFYVLVAIAGYLIMSLATYSTSDPSWSHSGPSANLHNLGGRAGAFIVDVLLNLFGFLAYLFPLMVAYSAFKMFQHRKDMNAPNFHHKAIISGGFVLLLIGACGLATLHFDPLAKTLPFSAGGLLGDAMGGGLTAAFSFIGATIFLLALFLAGATLFSGLSWFWLMDVIGKTGFEFYGFVRSRISEQLDRTIGEQARREREEKVIKQNIRFDSSPKPRIEPVIHKFETSARIERERQVPMFEVPSGSELPPLSLLDKPEERKRPSFSEKSLESMARLLEKKLIDFNIQVQVVEIHPGPVITRFEIEPAPGVKAVQISNLASDLARSLSVVSLRVVENIPGKTCMGIEIPNEFRESVRLSEILSSEAYEASTSHLGLALGKDISGNPVVTDLTKMPHLLIAGTTGSGKSVCINALIMSLVYKFTPEQVRFIMVDPKMLELATYEGIPHLLAPVVTDMKQAANALRWCIFEMERRYRLMAALGVRNIGGYSRKIEEAEAKGKPLVNPLAQPGEDAESLTHLPFIVIFVDELADLMMVVGKKVEEIIARIAQKARAAGLHLILATQRPSVDVVTGLIKANIPARIAFQMSAKVDSRTVLDQMGAEQLLGQGDMLFLQPGMGIPQRIHGAFVSDEEVHRVVRTLKQNGKPIYNDDVLEGDPAQNADDSTFAAGISIEGAAGANQDPLYDEALRIVTETRRASISGVQRRLRVGYNRAARLIEEMERTGVVGELQSNGQREVLAPPPPKI
ncbi:MAG: DNA translocase FtsK 4TM domain-containing protein [Acidiferrobacterales bacterium]